MAYQSNPLHTFKELRFESHSKDRRYRDREICEMIHIYFSSLLIRIQLGSINFSMYMTFSIDR